MYVKEIKIQNFRLLKDFSLNLNDDLSMIIGKNNTGKTSLLTSLDKFINSQWNSKGFDYYDFSDEVRAYLEHDFNENEIFENFISQCFIKLRLKVSYNYSDNFEHFDKFIVDLDETVTDFYIDYEYSIKNKEENEFKLLLKDFKSYCSKVKKTDAEGEDGKSSLDPVIIKKYLSKNLCKFFALSYKIVSSVDETETKDIRLEDLKKLISFSYISAKRDVDNSKNNSLSRSAESYYSITENSKQTDKVMSLLHNLAEIDNDLNDSYNEIFSDFYNHLKKFNVDDSGMQVEGRFPIEIQSNLSFENLLRNNIKFVCNSIGGDIPETHNGLGYMNLISILLEIKLRVEKVQKLETNPKINLFFIEEPEAYAHPQMQYVFIKNIKSFLNEISKGLKLQSFISTHSPHILSNVDDFNNIIYLKKFAQDKVSGELSFLNVEAKYLSDLEATYKRNNKKDHFSFLKKYLTISNAELMFADKAIFIEGPTERILLPEIMKKMDKKRKEKRPPVESNVKDLLSQNISIIELGNYVHVFKDFLEFLGIKSLIITDIDPSRNNVNTRNGSIKDITRLEKITELNKRTMNEDSLLEVVYQKPFVTDVSAGPISNYAPRTFEDYFIAQNFDWFNKNFDNINVEFKYSWKVHKQALDKAIEEKNYLTIASKIKSKTGFALLLIMLNNSGNEWEIPSYIEEGLKWIQE